MIHPAPLASASRPSALASIWTTISLAALVVVLLASNGATLTNESAHSTGYRLLEKVIGVTLSTATAYDLLSNSPSQIRKVEVESKTQALRAERDALHLANRTVSGERDAIAARHKELAARHQALSTDHDSLKAQAAKRADIAKATSKRIGTKVSAVAARGVSSFLPRVAPAAGAAVSAGILAWDIADLCDTMKALSDLDSAFENSPADQKNVCGLSVPKWN